MGPTDWTFWRKEKFLTLTGIWTPDTAVKLTGGFEVGTRSFLLYTASRPKIRPAQPHIERIVIFPWK
jgi:hypothetical protein